MEVRFSVESPPAAALRINLLSPDYDGRSVTARGATLRWPRRTSSGSQAGGRAVRSGRTPAFGTICDGESRTV
jgi:hypothetical protein